MQDYSALIAKADAVAYKPGYGMLGDLVGYLKMVQDGGFEFCEVDHFCDEMNDDVDAVVEGCGADDFDDVPEDERLASGREEIGAAFELIEEGYNAERGDSEDTDYEALAVLLVSAIEKRIAWLETL